MNKYPLLQMVWIPGFFFHQFMQYEGIHRAADRNNQGICDISQYAILREDWGNRD